MKKIILITLLSFLNANAFSTKIHAINLSNSQIVRVTTADSNLEYEVDKSNEILLGKLKTAKKYKYPVELTLDNQIITSLKIDYRVRDNYLRTAMSDYEPSNIASYEKAEQIFNGLYRKHKWFNQCFNRAHIWAKQMYNQHNVNSMKVLIYYTKKYRAEVSKKWWFHIAPVVSVNGELYVMDREFTRRPQTVDQWEDIFTAKIKDQSYRCKVIDNIAEYYDKRNMEQEYCNIQFVSMYYWEPNDMSNLDKTGEEKHQWVNWELRSAAKEAFWSWRKIYKELKQ